MKMSWSFYICSKNCSPVHSCNYDVFDFEGWVVGEAVRAKQYYIANKSEGHPNAIGQVCLACIDRLCLLVGNNRTTK